MQRNNNSPVPALAALCAVMSLLCMARAQGTASGSSSSLNPLVADRQTMLLFELAIAALVVAFLLVFLLGSVANSRLAHRLATELSEALAQQFARIGTESGKLLLKDGQSVFYFYATGRRYTSGLTVLLDLAKRMDLFAYSSGLLSTPQKDRIVFYLPLTNDFNMEPVSMFLVRKKELAKLRDVQDGIPLKATEALGAHVSGANGIPAEYIVMSEHSEVVQALLPESVRSIIRDNARHLVSVHVTDNGASWDSQSRVSKRLVRVEFSLPFKTSQSAQVLEDMSRMSMQLVDAAAECKLTSAARKKALDLRKRVTLEEERRAQKQRAEDAQNRRLQKKKEEEEAVAKMSREKQAKYEEKKRKKELATRMKKAIRK